MRLGTGVDRSIASHRQTLVAGAAHDPFQCAVRAQRIQVAAYVDHINRAIRPHGGADHRVHAAVLEAPFHPAAALAGCHSQA